MRLLLDTHVYLWARAFPARIDRQARDVIERSDAVFVSIASAWEAAIKVGLGRLQLQETFEAGMAAGGFRPLSITLAHAERVATLPRLHGDPFDRMLVAQADCEGLTLVTKDSAIAAYGVAVLQA